MTGVSVILPTYNRAHTLQRAIASVLAQTHRELELIVVDDGSTDGTAELVQQIAASDARVRLIRQARNRGVSAARNVGLRDARHDAVAFQDSDDEWAPNKLELQLTTLQSGVALVTCGFDIPEDVAHSLASLGGGDVIDLSDRLLEIPSCQCWLTRRSLCEQAGGFDPELDCFEDWELALRLGSLGRLLMINRPLVAKHVTPGSLFQDHRFSRNLQRILDRHAGRLSQESRLQARFSLLIAQAEALHGTMPEARAWFRRSLAARPFAVRAWISLVMTYLGRGTFTRFLRSARAARSRMPAR